MKGFKFAINGIKEAISTQVNFRFHLTASLFVVIGGLMLRLAVWEWVMITFCIGLVVITELLNTSVEYLVNLVSPNNHPLAGKIKDLSAGAVLIAAITSMIVGLIIFVPKIIKLL